MFDRLLLYLHKVSLVLLTPWNLPPLLQNHVYHVQFLDTLEILLFLFCDLIHGLSFLGSYFFHDCFVFVVVVGLGLGFDEMWSIEWKTSLDLMFAVIILYLDFMMEGLAMRWRLWLGSVGYSTKYLKMMFYKLELE